MDYRWLVTLTVFLIVIFMYFKKFKNDTFFKKSIIFIYLGALCMILFSPLIFGQNAKIGVTAFGVSQSKPFVLNVFSKQFLFNVLIILPFGSILKIKKVS